MSKITFVYPDFENLGIEYLMSVCRQKGYDTSFIYYRANDTYVGRKEKIVYDRIAGKIIETKPDFVAFSCVTDNYQYQLNCARALKKQMPQVKTIFGGIHPTAVPEKVIKEDCVDCLTIGEAEISLIQFLKTQDETKGIVFKDGDRLVGKFIEGELPNLNDIPFPYKEPYLSCSKDSLNEYRIMSSRGCKYVCSYCFNSFINKARGNCLIRQRTVDNVIYELSWAKKYYPLNISYFLMILSLLIANGLLNSVKSIKKKSIFNSAVSLILITLMNYPSKYCIVN